MNEDDESTPVALAVPFGQIPNRSFFGEPVTVIIPEERGEDGKMNREWMCILDNRRVLLGNFDDHQDSP